jgi:hypothetical protein
MNAIRFIQDHPLIYPIASISPGGLELRRRSISQFVILYTYFEPKPDSPDGIVSIRAIRHAAEEDVFFGVSEARACGACINESRALETTKPQATA